MQFTGFTEADFDLFSIADFAGRMGEIRATLRPKLAFLGEDLAEPLGEIAGEPLFVHVAQHMRRRVNPPEETWAAFARVKRGYKRWTHYRVAVSSERLRVTVFIEDDADDKPVFGAYLVKRGGVLLKELGKTAPVEWYTFGDEAPVPQSRVTGAMLKREGEALQRLKGRKFQAGVSLPRADVLAATPEELERWILEQARVLQPIYAAGTS